jgi:hypothetical protein
MNLGAPGLHKDMMLLLSTFNMVAIVILQLPLIII